MTFVSPQFLIFLPAVVLLYYLLPHKLRWILLLAASYYAYMSWNAWLIFPIFATTLVSYLAAILTAKTKKKRVKKLLLVSALTVCLGTLVFFKYFNFLIQNAVEFLNLFSMNLEAPVFDIILPVGISFYTFQTLSYCLDVYRGTVPAEKHFGYYALYVSFFPQLVAGPIERPETLLPQLKEKRKPNKNDFADGFRIMAVGFFRKCVVADFLGKFVNSVFLNLNQANSFAILAAGAFFVVQVYCDFAGYSEIAIGSARLMGIKLMKNFDKPLSATSVRDLMRRWHISLNTWFRDYVYIPLGGSKKGGVRRFFNVMTVYFLCGLWHGADWTFVMWGLYVGFFLCVEGYLRKPYKRFCEKHKINHTKAWIILLRQILVFLFFIPAALFFRAQSLSEIGLIFARIFSGFGFGAGYFEAALNSLSMSVIDLLQLIALIVCLILIQDVADYKKSGTACPCTGRMDSCVMSLYSGRVAALFYITVAVALGWLILVSGDGLSSFVYFQF